MDRIVGTVKWFDAKKGFGFIAPDQPVQGVPKGKDLFVHISAIKSSGIDTLIDNQRVEFTVGMNKGKPCAEELRTLS